MRTLVMIVTQAERCQGRLFDSEFLSKGTLHDSIAQKGNVSSVGCKCHLSR